MQWKRDAGTTRQGQRRILGDELRRHEHTRLGARESLEAPKIVHAWLAAVDGFTALHWACESRDPARVLSALRGNAVRDASARCGADGAGPTALELASRPEAFPHEPSPVRKETAALVRAALAPWSPSTHRVQTAAFRRGVLAVLCVGARLRGEAGRRRSRRCRRGGRGAAMPLPLLPPEVWVCVLGHCTRDWWGC